MYRAGPASRQGKTGQGSEGRLGQGYEDTLDTCLFRTRPVGLVWKKASGARSTRSIMRSWIEVEART